MSKVLNNKNSKADFSNQSSKGRTKNPVHLQTKTDRDRDLED
jgi:hypothetical protein